MLLTKVLTHAQGARPQRGCNSAGGGGAGSPGRPLAGSPCSPEEAAKACAGARVLPGLHVLLSQNG